MKKNKIIIIGAGASGLMAAIKAKEAGFDVRILERMNRIGKKILATGNGKCNLTNSFLDHQCYRSENKEFPYQIISRFGASDTIDFFESLGLLLKERDGYYYPNSEQAVSVLDALTYRLNAYQVPIDLETTVTRIEKKHNVFFIQTDKGKYQADRVILATGGCAQKNLGSDGSGYQLAKALGHTIVPTVSALAALQSNLTCFKEWAGVRTQGAITLLVGEQAAAHARGEIQLTRYGISGVPTFQICRYAARALLKKQKVTAVLDFIPSMSFDELMQRLMIDKKNCSYKTTTQLLEGYWNKKLLKEFLKAAGIKSNQKVSDLAENDIKRLAKKVKEFEIPIVKANDFDQAQVISGGVSTNEIDPDTMESKLVKNLYLTGELLDVDGTCGGYNLQWAWSTGFLAGTNMENIQ